MSVMYEQTYNMADNVFPSHRKWIFSALVCQKPFKLEELEDQTMNCLASSYCVYILLPESNDFASWSHGGKKNIQNLQLSSLQECFRFTKMLISRSKINILPWCFQRA